MSASSKAAKGPWDNEAHEVLVVAIAEALGGIPKEHQGTIVKIMKARGQNFTWEAIRRSQDIMARFVKKWDETMNCDLFESIYDVTKTSIGQEEQTAIVERMRAKGYDVNWNGIRQHLTKLRKKQENDPAAPIGEPSTPKSTPRQRATKKSGTGSGKRKSKAMAMDEFDDESPEYATPSKKVKKEEPVVKQEMAPSAPAFDHTA